MQQITRRKAFASYPPSIPGYICASVNFEVDTRRAIYGASVVSRLDSFDL
jgi:hypothetical protein